VEPNQVVFRSGDGSVVGVVPLAEYATSSVSLPSGPAIESIYEKAFAAESQSTVGIITQRTLRLDSAPEGRNGRSTFRYFSNAGKLLFSRDSDPERHFF